MTDKEQRELAMIKIIKDTLWMAKRYADGRSSYAPAMVNGAIDSAIRLGIKFETESGRIEYAKDGMFGDWNADLRRFEASRD